MVSRAVELGYPALALTDHDNLCGTMEFAQVARSLDIQPISGAEVTTAAGGHLTFLASDRTGYGNLCQLVTFSYMDAERRDPKLSDARLAEHSQGVILLTGCCKGLIPSLASQGRMEEAETVLRQYVEWFDADIDNGVTRLNRLVEAERRTCGPDPAPTLAAVRAALDDDLDASTARDAIDVLAGAIIAHAGDDPTAPAGLRQAAGLLGIHLDETPPGDAPSGT